MKKSFEKTWYVFPNFVNCFFQCLQFNFASGSGDVIYVPENPIGDVWMIAFEFTPFISGKDFFIFYDLLIKICCEGQLIEYVYAH